MYVDFRREVTAALRSAPEWKSAAFMASCCEPMLQNYRLYRRQHKRGSVIGLRRALDLIWEWALTGESANFPGEIIDKVYKLSPARLRVRKFSLLEQAAYDTCSAIAFTMDGGAEAVEEVCDEALQTILNGAGHNQPSVGDKYYKHSELWLQWEMQRQRDCLDRLLKASDESRHYVVTMFKLEGSAAGPSLLSSETLADIEARLVDAELDAVQG